MTYCIFKCPQLSGKVACLTVKDLLFVKTLNLNTQSSAKCICSIHILMLAAWCLGFLR